MTRSEMRHSVYEKIVDIDGISTCSVESLRKIRGKDLYDAVIRVNSEVSLSDLSEIGRVFKGATCIVEADSEEMPYCNGAVFSFLRISLEGISFN